MVKKIRTWQERCQDFDDLRVISHQDIQNKMQEEIDDQADRIAELEKDLALKTRDRDVFKNFTLAYEERIAELEKAKTLTDDEIEEFAYAFELWQLNNPDKALEGIKDFARAILRKAQEK